MSRRTAGFACVLVLTCACARAASAQPALPPSRVTPAEDHTSLLDVPYVPQSEALCGGASLAMVLRYWQDVPVYAEDFAALVDGSAEGIRLADLTDAARARGWQALPFAAEAQDVRDHLRQGRPIIALIEDRPGRHHYVVVVAWTADRVAFHDPARGPFRILDVSQFERAWQVTGHTALLVLPGPTTSDIPRLPDTAATAVEPSTCRAPVDRAVELARGGQLAEADLLLAALSDVCPHDSAPLRELAGIRFARQRWRDTAHLASQALERDTADMHAWQLLAASRFLDNDPRGALTAWNRRDEPRIDLTQIEGLERTRHDVLASMLNLPPQTVLTAAGLDRAARRIDALPAIRTSRVDFSPRAAGTASVDVAVVERPLVESGWPGLIAVAARAAIEREARFDLASPTGNGELWSMSGRWWAARPRLGVSLVMPRLWRWTGLWRIDGSWERQSYDSPTTSSTATFVSHRRHAGVSYSDWLSGTTRVELTTALDHWRDRGRQVSTGVALEQRALADHLALRAEGAFWPAARSASGFSTAAVTTAWRSTRNRPFRWTARGGVSLASQNAPLDMWTGADSGHVRPALLRAHPLLDDGVIATDRLGRRLAHATVEFERPLIDPASGARDNGDAVPATTSAVVRRSLGTVKWAAFADAARVLDGIKGDGVTQVDVGVGLRVHLPGTPAALRLDIARGLRDGRTVLSAGWQTAWPGW